MSRPRVLVMGNNTLDQVFRLHGNLVVDSKVQAQSYQTFAGGQAANVAVTLAFLGFEVWYLGRFGDDAAAAQSRAALVAAGVDLRLSQEVSACPQHLACVLVAGAARSIVMYKDPRLGLDSVSIPAEVVAGCAAVYTDGHEGAASLQLAELAAAVGVPVLADIEVVTPLTRRLAQCANHLVVPGEILCQLTAQASLPAALSTALAAGPAAVVATLGSRGAIGLDRPGATPLSVAASACELVDTTGAGDAFHAGYLAGLLNGQNLSERMHFAADVAALKCSVAGPRLTPEVCRSLRLLRGQA